MSFGDLTWIFERIQIEMKGELELCGAWSERQWRRTSLGVGHRADVILPLAVFGSDRGSEVRAVESDRGRRSLRFVGLFAVLFFSEQLLCSLDKIYRI